MSKHTMTQKTCVTRYTYLWLLFLVNLGNLTLIFLNITFVLMQYLSKTHTSILAEFGLFAFYLTDSMVEMWNDVLWTLTWPWPDTEPWSLSAENGSSASWGELSNAASPRLATMLSFRDDLGLAPPPPPPLPIQWRLAIEWGVWRLAIETPVNVRLKSDVIKRRNAISYKKASLITSCIAELRERWARSFLSWQRASSGIPDDHKRPIGGRAFVMIHTRVRHRRCFYFLNLTSDLSSVSDRR